MMKTEELMVGDLVTLVYDYGKESSNPLEIDARSIVRVYEGMYKVEPIELTEEILEKNGFKKETRYDLGFSGQWYSPDRRIVCEADEVYLNSDNKWYVHIDNESFESIGSCELTYVHELQHLFNLVKYKMKINL